MAKHALSFVALHNQFFMQGSNLGDKINALQRGVKLLLDDERHVVWVHFKGKVSFIPLASIASADVVEIPNDVKEALGFNEPVASAPVEPKKRGPGRPPAIASVDLTLPTELVDRHVVNVPMPTFDPNDAVAAAKHRELVRAASANSTKPGNRAPQNDYLIQEARNQAMGMKHPITSKAQVSNPQQVGAQAQTGVTGKPKAISHEGMKAQVAQELKS